MPESRPPLTRDAVLLAAVRLADEHGLAALSMRRLAQALGVEAMSLYNHVRNKDDLLDGIADLVVGEMTPPAAGGDWKAALRARSASAHEVLLRHPWATGLIGSRINVGPAMLRYIDATVGCLRAAGFSLPQADRAWNALDSHLYGFTLQELHFPLAPSEYASAAQQFLPRIPAEEYPHMNALSQLVIDGKHTGIADFGFGLDLILDGLERLLTESAD
ncbi:TetR/AcrR family transcriptional regulator C-terminal domain-containing protein [Streptomyces gardneri]|uniref:TetR/AcrR family transcriptional regulator C-terminal domain-containing protein n=1 Tax=Nocardia TaxID=1817 RepID=UPI001357EB11|nr:MULTISPECIES: TetR/AcrR family transcriptional regulator C-terminal domain-containing protein [Nocardia]MBF6166549.1 TetR/AcrR family transcriptional regulator C-terminal domain-containing protein [Streptomyces gardneri]MBF6205521.1 TetR/AcrR family transcriptional regulator C-terminal domain-containing protein [Streptomyces gardneri]UAK34610.1 TetR/AcrR family transcriptional regulator C-terminal domain-containing protein [Nocardia asteroides]